MIQIGPLVTEIQNIEENVCSISYSIHLFEKYEKSSLAKQFYSFSDFRSRYQILSQSMYRVKSLKCSYIYISSGKIASFGHDSIFVFWICCLELPSKLSFAVFSARVKTYFIVNTVEIAQKNAQPRTNLYSLSIYTIG